MQPRQGILVIMHKSLTDLSSSGLQADALFCTLLTAYLFPQVYSLFHFKTIAPLPPHPPSISIQGPPPPCPLTGLVPHAPAAFQLNELAPFATACCNVAQDSSHQTHYVGITVLCQGRLCISCNWMVLQRGQKLAGPCTERAVGSQCSAAQFCGLANSPFVSRCVLLLLPLQLLGSSNRPITGLFCYVIGHFFSCINFTAPETS